jgi:hypothetical protein
VAVPAAYTRYMNQACIYMRKVGEAVKDGWQPIAAEAQNLRMAQVAPSSREATMTNDSKSPVSITGRSDREEPDASRRDFFQHAEAAAGWLVLAEQMEWIDRERERKTGPDEPS